MNALSPFSIHHILAHPVNTLSLCTLRLHPLNTPHQYTLSTQYEYSLSAHPTILANSAPSSSLDVMIGALPHPRDEHLSIRREKVAPLPAVRVFLFHKVRTIPDVTYPTYPDSH